MGATLVAGPALPRLAKGVEVVGPEVEGCADGVPPGAFLFLEGAGAGGRLEGFELTGKLDIPGRPSFDRFGVEALLPDD